MALNIEGGQEYIVGTVTEITVSDQTPHPEYSPNGSVRFGFTVVRDGNTTPDEDDQGKIINYGVFINNRADGTAATSPWDNVKVGDHREFACVTNKKGYKNFKATELLEAATAESVAHVEAIAAQPRPMSAAKMTEQRSISRSVALKAAVEWAIACIAVVPDNYQTIGNEITNMADTFETWLMRSDIDDILGGTDG